MGTTRTVARWRTLLVASLCIIGSGALAHGRDLTIDDRVAAAKAVEQVYWEQRIWPEGNPGSKPPLEAVLPESAIRARLAAASRADETLEAIRGHAITGAELQDEIDRMVRDTKASETLHAIFAALGDDPFLIAECVARPALTERLLREVLAAGRTLDGAPLLAERAAVPPAHGYELPAFPQGTGCVSDTWSLSTLTTGTGPQVPAARQFHTALWTGAEMIVWGGWDGASTAYDTGGRYDPATDSWSLSTLTTATGPNVPAPRYRHTAIWTGTEMIVWGGTTAAGVALRSGGRYNVATDSWATSDLTSGAGANIPSARALHTAVWTGTEMIVWGGSADTAANARNTGGRYDPATDSWAVSILNNATGTFVPDARIDHTAVWTGTEMIVWGGLDATGTGHNDGGRFNPATDIWSNSTLTSATGPRVPSGRHLHTAVWTGTDMIVWGGAPAPAAAALNNGGRYDPVADLWKVSSLATATGANVPAPRRRHTAVWTGLDMIIWGGSDGAGVVLNNGGRYSPLTDAWPVTTLTTPTGVNIPSARHYHTAVYTGAADHRMIVWGGSPNTATGGLYCAACIAVTWFIDGDGDGFGTGTTTQVSCTQPGGFAGNAADCDDTDPAIHPGAAESCNGADDDCDNVIDEGGNALCSDGDACTADLCDPAGACAVPSTANLDATGFSATRVDGRDLVVLADAWNSCPGDLRYDANANLDQGTAPPGSCIDLEDFHLFMSSFGENCP